MFVSSKSQLCGGCFAGLTQRKNQAVPDTSPETRVQALTYRECIRTLEEAMKLNRPDQGRFVPSPGGKRKDSVGSWASPGGTRKDSASWASPMPRDCDGIAVATAGSVDFDLSIEDAEAAKGGLGNRMDRDLPAKRAPRSQGKLQVPSKYEAEMLLSSPGSLPKPMSAEQREAAIRSLLPTATFQMLSKVDPQLLKTADANGQALRRRLASGATLVFVCAGLPGKRFAYERAAALGLKIVMIEHPDSWSRGLMEEGIIAKFLPVDMSQSADKVFADAMRHIQDLGRDGVTGAADGIATFVELVVPLVSRLCEALGLPGHKPEAVDSARDKHATRRCLAASGLPTPRNALIKTADDLEECGRRVGFPCVMKPCCGAASLGVKKASSMEELHTFYHEIVAELRTLVVTSGALVKGDPNSKIGVEADKVIDLTVLLEQYLDGPEVDVDVIMSDGDWRYAAVADNGPTLEPYFNETWGLCPSVLPKKQQYELRQLAVDAVKALGFAMGIFHVELKYTSAGPQLIEVNARMGGGQIHETNLRTWGVDLVEETLLLALGIPSRPPVPKMPLAAIAYSYVNASRSGQAGDLSKLAELARREGVVWAKPLVKPGAHVVGPEEGLPTWMCDLLVTRRTPKEALEFLQSLEAEEPVSIV